jgi:hypothetical protein
MFVGHFAPGFAIKAMRPAMPLWLLFLAGQLVDVGWAVLVLLGIERLRIVPGFTASNPFDLYYMPYTHSLVAVTLWAAAAVILCKPLPGVRLWPAAALIGIAVFSHWVLDFVVHGPDLPLYANVLKVGLGIWNIPALAVSLEAALLCWGMIIYVRRTKAINAVGRFGPIAFGIVMLGAQAYSFFGPPPDSPRVAATTVLVFYAVSAGAIHWLDRQRVVRPTSTAGRQREEID